MSAFDLLQLTGGTLAKGAILVLAACAGAHLLRGRSAASRYAVWSAAFLGLVLLPALTLSLPVLDPPALVQTTPIAPSAASSFRERSVASPQFGEHQMFSRSAGGERATMRHTIAASRPDGMLGHTSTIGSGTAWGTAARAAAPWLLVAWLS